MVYEQLRVFTAFFILGIISIFIFDFFRAKRKVFKTNNLFTYIDDIIYFLIIGFMYLKTIIVFSSGEIRFYMFIASVFGILIYFLTIGNLCAIMFKVILDSLKKFILCFIRFIKIPIKKFNIVIQKLNKRFKNNS